MKSIQDCLVDVYTSRILVNERMHSNYALEKNRQDRRSLQPRSAPKIERPWYWEHRGFNPYTARANAEFLSRVLSRRFKTGTFQVKPSALLEVPKDSGGFRSISVHSVADEAASKYLYLTLINKNAALFSSRSYAYRPRIAPIDAISHIRSYWKSAGRLYVGEYDFKSFFDNISHDYIWHCIDSLGVYISTFERDLIYQFLRAPAFQESGRQKDIDWRNGIGIPQGTSISLFLANLVLTPLDRRLEEVGVGFSRYADDTLLWSKDYSATATAVEIIYQYSREIGAPLNFEKSPGVSLLARNDEERSELPSKTHVSFLGSSIGLDSVTISSGVEKRIKKKVLDLVYENLLREPLRNKQNMRRLEGSTDKDYVTLIWQLRRFIYGGMSESQIKKMKSLPRIPRVGATGAIGSLLWAVDESTLRGLDNFIVDRIYTGLRKRRSLLLPAGRSDLSSIEPWTRKRSELHYLRVRSDTTGQWVDLTIPSFARSKSLAVRSVEEHGPRAAGNPPGWKYTFS